MSKTVSVRVSDDTYDAVADAADECGLSINDWLKLDIQQCLQFSEFKQSEDTGGNTINIEGPEGPAKKIRAKKRKPARAA